MNVHSVPKEELNLFLNRVPLCVTTYFLCAAKSNARVLPFARQRDYVDVIGKSERRRRLLL